MRLNSGWILASIAALIYCITQWMAVSGIDELTVLMALLLLGATVGCAFETRAHRFLPYICFLSLFGFPEYSADPYLQNYVAPFTLAKMPAFLSMLLMLRFRFEPYGVLVGIILATSTLAAIALDRFGNWYAEIWYAILLLLALNTNSPLAEQAKAVWFDAIERLFYLLVPVAFFSYATGLYDQRSADTTTYFYGHWIGIVSALAIYRATSGRSKVFSGNIVRFPLIALTVYVCSASYQSAHFIFIALAAVMASTERLSERASLATITASFTMLLAIPIAGVFVISNFSQDSWLYLKVSQISALATGSYLETSNSVAIRVAQFISLFEQSSVISMLGGRGMASTYLPEGSIWQYVVLHQATYPEVQLVTGEFQYIHESVTMLIKWIGLIGTVLVLYIIYRKLHAIEKLKSIEGLSALMFLLLFASSLHTGILVTTLLIFSFSSTRKNISRKPI